MKKASTWYLFALVVLNLLLAWGTLTTTEMLKMALPAGSYALPDWTMLLIMYSWWPYLFAGFASLLAVASIVSRWSSTTFYHLIIVSLIIESFILFISQISYVMTIKWMGHLMP